MSKATLQHLLVSAVAATDALVVRFEADEISEAHAQDALVWRLQEMSLDSAWSEGEGVEFFSERFELAETARAAFLEGGSLSAFRKELQQALIGSSSISEVE